MKDVLHAFAGFDAALSPQAVAQARAVLDAPARTVCAVFCPPDSEEDAADAAVADVA